MGWFGLELSCRLQIIVWTVIFWYLLKNYQVSWIRFYLLESRLLYRLYGKIRISGKFIGTNQWHFCGDMFDFLVYNRFHQASHRCNLWVLQRVSMKLIVVFYSITEFGTMFNKCMNKKRRFGFWCRQFSFAPCSFWTTVSCSSYRFSHKSYGPLWCWMEWWLPQGASMWLWLFWWTSIFHNM